MYHTVFYHDKIDGFSTNQLFYCNSKDIFTVVERFENQHPTKMAFSVTMFDGMQWIKREFVGWETI